ncbi:MBL fold metallo-hydrolase [Lysinibacillus sp. RS5]
MTHGHFDHVGAIIDLIEHWGMAVAIFLHECKKL